MADLLAGISLDDAPEVALDGEALSRVAALATALSQRDILKHGDIVPEKLLVPFEALSDQGKANARATAYRVVQALVMLGYVESPG